MTNIFNEKEIKKRMITREAITIEVQAFDNGNKLYTATIMLADKYTTKDSVRYFQATGSTQEEAITLLIEFVIEGLNNLK